MEQLTCNNCSESKQTKEFFSKIRKNDFKERSKKIIEVLHSKPLCFNELAQQSGFNRKTVSKLLKYLLQSKKIIRIPETSNGKKGRPKVFYSLTQETNQKTVSKVINRTGVVSLEFSKLKRACRFEKGGNCKEKKGKCSTAICPLIT